MTYKQRHIIIKATPHDQNEYVVGDMCRVDSVRSVFLQRAGSVSHMIAKNRQACLCTYKECYENNYI